MDGFGKRQTLGFLLSASLFFLALFPPHLTASALTLAWDPNAEPDLAGYKIYHGTQSGIYGFVLDVGNVTQYTVTGLEPETQYYFSLTAYDTSGNESDFSAEVSAITGEEELAADFGIYGLWYYVSSWSQLAASNPSLLGSYAHKLVVKFPSGLYEYDGSWTMIASSNCEHMAGVGSFLYVDFGSLGLWRYDGNWAKVAMSNPSLLGAYANKLVVKFPSGLYEYDGSWTMIASSNCEHMAGVDSFLYVDFGSLGLWRYDGNWTKIASSDIEDMTALDLNPTPQ